jgi:membrane fusion protein, multidrug efflux system
MPQRTEEPGPIPPAESAATAEPRPPETPEARPRAEPAIVDGRGRPLEKPARPLHRRPLVIALALVLTAGLAVLGARYLVHARHYESTDDAFIEGRIISITPRAAGHVVAVRVDDNQVVQAGQVLVEIDPRDYAARVDQARAQVQAAETEAQRAATDAERVRVLFARQLVAKQDLDHAVAESRTTQAQAAVARETLAQASLELSYTTIQAPEAGRVTRRVVEQGMFVQVGQALMAVVPNDFWVIANFKETQLNDMRPGQPATVRVDAQRGRTLRGHVDSIQTGTGARFSLLPPENATGNFVKVVQRVPVKIVLDDAPDPAQPLGPGMSVVPEVRVR